MDENMDENMVISFVTDDGEEVEFFVLEQTKLNGIEYLLVSDTLDDEDEDVEVYIMKEIKEEDGLTSYEFVEDENEIGIIGKLFQEILEESDMEL